MTRSLSATCQGGQVKVDGVIVPEAVILSQGVGPSSGTLFIDGERAFYVAKTSPDLDKALEKAIDALAAASDGISAVGGSLGTIAGATGDLGAIAAAASASSQASAAASSIDTAKAALVTLKGMLR